tara:strand:- start:1800 stop:2246 length:447 start_codon:yes stop_codon:yes gene_type:complete
MANKAVEFIITEYQDHNLVHFKMVRDDIKRKDVHDFLEEFLEMITRFKNENVRYYGLWHMNLTTLLPPTYIKIITDFMPKIREIGAEVNLGSAIVFKSGTIRSLLNNYIVKYKMDANWIKFIKTPDLGLDFLKEIGMKDLQKNNTISI